MTEETYAPKIFRPKHTRLSELKAEAVKKDRRKKLTQSKFVGGTENTAHPRVTSASEMRQESEQVSLGDCWPLSPSAAMPPFDLSLLPCGCLGLQEIHRPDLTRPSGLLGCSVQEG